MYQTLAMLVLGFAVLLLSGCTSLDLSVPRGQETSWQLAVARKTTRETTRYLALRRHYEKKTCEGHIPGEDDKNLKNVRDEIIGIQIQWISQYHDMYLRDRVYGTGLSSDGLEVISLGTSAAATVVGGTVVKSALAGTSTIASAIKSPLLNGISRLRLTEAVLTRMEANRRQALAKIERGRMLPVHEYPLFRADEDLLEYFYSISPDRAAADILTISRTPDDASLTPPTQ